MSKVFHYLLFCFIIAGISCHPAARLTTTPSNFQVIAYYHGNAGDLQRYKFGQLTHVIFSFCHLKGNRMAVDNSTDSIAITRLVALKQQHPQLKIQLSLGGWCGCKSCSTVFSDPEGRKEFAESVRQLMQTYHTDGIDLDWEYPAIEGCPGHPFITADRHNFTLLITSLRQSLGNRYELSFAAGGFPDFFDHAVEWDQIMPLLDRVNLMSYDMVNGFSTVTGHHTGLYSTDQQPVSLDAGVKHLVRLGVPRAKIVIGAAFYARTWENVADTNHGLYQSGKFKSYVPFSRFSSQLTASEGFVFYRDPVAQAPYAYSAAGKTFATFDDAASLARKTQYARDEKLGGIMFWELSSDSDDGALLNAIYEAVKK
jgi:chitinase